MIANHNQIHMVAIRIAIDLSMRPANGNVMRDAYTARAHYLRLVLKRYLRAIVEPLFCFQGSFGYQTLKYLERKCGKNIQQIQEYRYPIIAVLRVW